MHALHIPNAKSDTAVWKPVFLSMRKVSDRALFQKLLRTKRIQRTSDDYEEQLRELYAIEHPSEVFSPEFENRFQQYIARKYPTLAQRQEAGNWVYYPWNSSAVHILPRADFLTVRTARNCYLIDAVEQKHFYNATVGIAGLSVGGSIAIALVLQGGAGHIKLADADSLALSNMNRIRAGVQDLGLPKTIMTARQIYEINPYAQVEIFNDGLTARNMAQFFRGLTVVVDEIDNLGVKYLMRVQAKKQKVPLVTAADSADGAVLDVERYDQKPQPKLFHGRLGNITYDQLRNLNKFGIGKAITQWVGPENITERMQRSLLQIGKTIVSWPQLGGAAMLNGAVVAYCIRKIVNKQPLENSRAIFSLDEKLEPGFFSDKQKKLRAQTAKQFREMYGL